MTQSYTITPERSVDLNSGFVDFKGERFYKIGQVNRLRPFFMSMVSHSDHWLFVSSNTGLTAGRVSSEHALFPYVAVDKVEDSFEVTGNKAMFRVSHQGQIDFWEPFSLAGHHDPLIQRNLYKHVLGNKICFEETHSGLNLIYRYIWSSSEVFGFVVDCELENLSENDYDIELVDGMQNILPANVPLEVQTNASNLVDAYRLNEIMGSSGLGVFSLYSGITDKPQPVEILAANVVYCLGFDQPNYLLSSQQLTAFRAGKGVVTETVLRGVRASYFVHTHIHLVSSSTKAWCFVANVSQSQNQVEALLNQLANPQDLKQSVELSVKQGTEKLNRIIARADSLQLTASEMADVHHYTNTLFNCLRGGVFLNQYRIEVSDLVNDVKHFNKPLYNRHANFFAQLPAEIDLQSLNQQLEGVDDDQLKRLVAEYLPITFGRRHGDPSRPWNKFNIKLKDSQGKRILFYEGNWRDIFQNWEALLISYPEFIDSAVSKFVNASTVDGFNPYRITKKGIDWEIEDPKDPWSYIGYWGDHQIIYLLKLLELSNNYYPNRLAQRLFLPLFAYANVPYRIKSFKAIVQDSKNTIIYDEKEEQRIAERVATLGADGRLVLDADNRVYQVTLLEKLLVPLLAKLSNFVLEGGIWLNTQRPEWNDANNALVGQGISMVTLYYMRRYIVFLINALPTDRSSATLSSEVSEWLAETSSVLNETLAKLDESSEISDAFRFNVLSALGEAGSRYRERVYSTGFSGKTNVDFSGILSFLNRSLALVNITIKANQRSDQLYHAYNVLELKQQSVKVKPLYSMLEGQVAALSSGSIELEESIELLNSLFESAMYRNDQHTFLLYPDKPQQGFLDKNRIDASFLMQDQDLKHFITETNQSVLVANVTGLVYRFNASITEVTKIDPQLEELNLPAEFKERIQFKLANLYSSLFNHNEFTGRSQGMFGFEGLGCTYWHMVSKLLLAVQEVYFASQNKPHDPNNLLALGRLYYKIRAGLGFNKTPSIYGAFPYDPYSHTPSHAGAQQPGMTGQVKEEILTRFGELGLFITNGEIRFNPCLLRDSEVLTEASKFNYYDLSNTLQSLQLPQNGLAFTLFQVPFVYQLTDGAAKLLVYSDDDIIYVSNSLVIPAKFAKMLFARTGQITKVKVQLNLKSLLSA